MTERKSMGSDLGPDELVGLCAPTEMITIPKGFYDLPKPLRFEETVKVIRSDDAYPDNNPKTAIGVTKAPMHLVPPALIHFTAEAFADGAKKYGPYNWRDKTVSSSVYYGAAMRHLMAWWDGQDLSEDAKVHHLGHASACLAILLDAMTVGKLNDDRPTAGAAGKLQAEYNKK